MADTKPAVIDFAADAGSGVDNLESRDLAIPYLAIIQKGSPQIDDDQLDVKPGDIFNTVTQESFDEILVVPCAYVRNFVEWVPRKQGGGFVNTFLPHELPPHKETEIETEDGGTKKVLMTENGNHLVETANHFCYYSTNGGD